MAELSRFFADVGGDRLTTAAQMNRIFDQILQEKDGVIRGLGNELAVTNSGLVAVDVNTGSAVMGGRLYENTASKNLALDAVTSGSKRYDRIVVRVDETARTMLLTVIKGVEGASPSVPAIDGTTDVLLAKILLDRSSGSYVYTVTDERVYCDGVLLPAIIAKLNAGTFSPDDLVDGTTYKRVLAAVATALNASTIVAGTQWGSGNDGNGGQPPAPKAQYSPVSGANGPGQYVSINQTTNYTIPGSGSTLWEFLAIVINTSTGFVDLTYSGCGVVAGGSTLAVPASHILIGHVWRQS